MPLDRKEPEYRALEIFLDEDLRDVLGRVVTDCESAETFLYRVTDLGASHSEKARLRLAMFLWNGSVPIDHGDLVCLDLDNRRRFVKALSQRLGV